MPGTSVTHSSPFLYFFWGTARRGTDRKRSWWYSSSGAPLVSSQTPPASTSGLNPPVEDADALLTGRLRVPRCSEPASHARASRSFVTRRTHSQVGSSVLNLSSLTRHALKQWLSNAYGIAASGRSLVLRPPLPPLKNSAPPRAGRGVEGLPSLSESFRLGKGLLRDSLALGGRSWLSGFG